MIAFIAGLVVGANLGVFVMAAMQVAQTYDDKTMNYKGWK
jgi:hypothetical protein